VDELNVLPWDARPARLAPGAPTPVEFVALSVPAQHGLRLDDDQRGAPAGPVPAEPDPEGPITAVHPGLLRLPLQDGELLVEGGDLCQKAGTGPGGVEEGGEQDQAS